MTSINKPITVDCLRRQANAYAARIGRRPRILLITKNEKKYGHRLRVLSAAFADFGFDVDIQRNVKTLDAVVRIAADNDVQVIGIVDFSTPGSDFPKLLLEKLIKERLEQVWLMIWVVSENAKSLHPKGLEPSPKTLVLTERDETADAAKAILDRLITSIEVLAKT